MSGRLADLVACDAVWLAGDGPQADIVLSTRARLARNVAGFPFPHRAGAAALATISADLGRQLQRLPGLTGGWTVDVGACEPRARQMLREKLLTGAELLTAPEHRVLIAGRDLAQVALLNAEDHLRLCAWRSGFAPGEALAAALAMDDALAGAFEPAFSQDCGYLTSSPANVGTGLRLTAVLHLPGLVMADEIDKVLNALRQLEFGVRGLAGEGRAVRGALFRVGNLTTLGRDEAEIAEDFTVHVGKVVAYERAARELLLGRDRRGLEDLAWRGLAALQHARLMSNQETWDCLSHARLGADLELTPGRDWSLYNRMLVRHQGAHLELAAGRALDAREKSAARADLLRELLAAR